MGRILIILVALITMGTAAHATTLATGGLYGGVTQNQATCYLFNAGDSTVIVSGKQIIRQGGGPVAFFTDNCGALAAGSICRFGAFNGQNEVHACKVVVEPDGAQIRGTLDIRTGANGITVLQTEQFR